MATQVDKALTFEIEPNQSDAKMDDGVGDLYKEFGK